MKVRVVTVEVILSFARLSDTETSYRFTVEKTPLKECGSRGMKFASSQTKLKFGSTLRPESPPLDLVDERVIGKSTEGQLHMRRKILRAPRRLRGARCVRTKPASDDEQRTPVGYRELSGLVCRAYKMN